MYYQYDKSNNVLMEELLDNVSGDDDDVHDVSDDDEDDHDVSEMMTIVIIY